MSFQGCGRAEKPCVVVEAAIFGTREVALSTACFSRGPFCLLTEFRLMYLNRLFGAV
jgi:hypothetical protein